MRYSWMCCLTLIVVLLGGCADDSGTTDVVAPDDPATEEPVTEDSEDSEDTEDMEGTEDAADAAAATVATAEGPGGEIVVDGEGMSLYMFENDEQGKSTCTDDCAATWPPLTTTGDPTAEGGADEGALGTITREDGSTQVTYNDWPLYHYAADSEPGDTAGQGIGDVWWLVAPAGEPVRDSG